MRPNDALVIAPASRSTVLDGHSENKNDTNKVARNKPFITSSAFTYFSTGIEVAYFGKSVAVLDTYITHMHTEE